MEEIVFRHELTATNLSQAFRGLFSCATATNSWHLTSAASVYWSFCKTNGSEIVYSSVK